MEPFCHVKFMFSKQATKILHYGISVKSTFFVAFLENMNFKLKGWVTLELHLLCQSISMLIVNMVLGIYNFEAYLAAPKQCFDMISSFFFFVFTNLRLSPRMSKVIRERCHRKRNNYHLLTYIHKNYLYPT